MVESIQQNFNSPDSICLIDNINKSCQKFIEISELALQKIKKYDIPHEKKSAMDSLGKYIDRLKGFANNPINNDSLNIILIGLTNSGKSTLGSALVGEDYFPSSNMAETYCPITLFDAILDVDPLYKITRVYDYDQRFEEKCFSNKESLMEEIESLTRKHFEININDKRIVNNEKKADSNHKGIDNNKEEEKELNEEEKFDYNKEILHRIQIHIKNLSNENNLPQGIIINDTPGISEASFHNITKDFLLENWTNSMAIVTMDLNSGTTNISLISELLEVFCENQATHKIIFVLTKVLSHILACEPKKIRGLSKDAIAQKAIAEANKTLSKFEDEIKKKYPAAKCLLYEQNAGKSKNYYYDKHKLQYRYKPSDEELSELIQVEQESIDYLKEIIKERALDVKKFTQYSIQLEKRRLITEFINTLYHISTQNIIINQRTTEFTLEIKNLISTMKSDFQVLIKNYIHNGKKNSKISFITTILPFSLSQFIHEDDPLLKQDIAEAILQTKKELDQRIWLKSTYQKYLAQNFPKKFENIVISRFSNELNKAINNFKTKFNDIINKYPEIGQEEQFLFKARSYNTRGYLISTWEIINNISSLGLLAMVSKDSKDLKFIKGPLGLGLGLLFTGAYLISWTKNGCNKQTLELIYNSLTKTDDFANKLLDIANQAFENLQYRLCEKAYILFTPSETGIPGFSEYQNLVMIRDEIQKYVDKMKEKGMDKPQVLFVEKQ